MALEETLKAGYGLQYCEVVPNLDDGTLPLRTLGIAGARYLRNILEHSRHKIIGIGHGRTLASAVEYLPRTPASDVQFVSLLGGLTRRFAANPFDVIHKLAERTAAEAYLMPVPAFANSVKDKNVLMSQFGVSDVVQLAAPGIAPHRRHRRGGNDGLSRRQRHGPAERARRAEAAPAPAARSSAISSPPTDDQSKPISRRAHLSLRG